MVTTRIDGNVIGGDGDDIPRRPRSIWTGMASSLFSPNSTGDETCSHGVSRSVRKGEKPIMMQNFDISELPEKITAYRNEVLSEALSRNSQYLQQMWQGVSEKRRMLLWQDLAQDAVNAMGSYMEPRVDSLEDGDDPRRVFYEGDESEPIRSYIAAWIEGYATCVLGGRCSEGEIRPMIEQSGVSLYPMDNRVAYAETVLPRRGYNEECVSVAIGHAILSYMIVLSDEIPKEERTRFNWMGDIDGFADGWRRARWDGLGTPGDGYVPYSEERHIDEFMRQVEDGAGPSKHAEATAEEAGERPADDEPADYVVSEEPRDDKAGAEPTGDMASMTHGNGNVDIKDDDQEGGQTDEQDGGDRLDPSETTGESLPEMYSSVLSGTSSITTQDANKTGIFIEVDDSGEERGGHQEAQGIVPAGDSAVFTTEDLDEFEDVSEEEVLRIKTKIAEESEASLTGAFVAIVPKEENTEGDPDVKERTLRRLPPIFEKYLMLSVSSALRGNAARIAELTEAGMTFEQSDRLRKKLMSATAKYGLKELAKNGLEDGIPSDGGDTEPVRTYANSWLQGYVSVITDGDNSQATIIRAAMLSIVGSDDIADDVRHVLDRQEWEGYDDECSMVAVAHLRVSLSSHSQGHPLAHPMEGSRKFSRRGATDGFSDGWWKAMEIVRRIAEAAEEGRQVNLPTPKGEEAEHDPEPRKAGDAQSTSDMERAKEEAKSLLAGLFVEDDILSETSVNDLIGAPRPIANPERAKAKAKAKANRNDDANHAGNGAKPEMTGTKPPEPETSQRTQQPKGTTRPKQRLTREERIRQHADQCAMQAVRQNADTVKWLWAETGLQKDGAAAWTDAVRRATAAYGWHIVNDLHTNPAKSSDGTRPMLSYAIGWIVGYAIGSGGMEMSDRELEGLSQKMIIPFSEVGNRSEYIRGMCAKKEYGPGCLNATMRRMKGMYLMHDDRNQQSWTIPDRKTYNWIADADGYADGWVVASRVRAQREGIE